MFDISKSEAQAIDGFLEQKLAWATNRRALSEQMALDASRLLSCTEDRLEVYAGQGFFKRCWFTLSGKVGEAERASTKDLVEMQKYAWRYINLLQERDLLAAHSIIAVKNNLLTLAVDQEEVRKEVCRLAGRVYDRFVALEERVGNIEVSQQIHGWLLTIDTRDYDEILPPNLRLLRVVSDFYSMKSDAWNVMELKYLQKAIKEVGLDPKLTVSVSGFVDAVIEEIEKYDYITFAKLMTYGDLDDPDNDFIIEAIAAPAFSSLYQIKHHYTTSSRVIRSLQKKMNISHSEALKTILADFIEERGIDTAVKVPLKDLATEILSCLSLARRLEPNEAIEHQTGAPFQSAATQQAGSPSLASAAETDSTSEPAGAGNTDENYEDFGRENEIDQASIELIRSGDIYSLLSVCDNEGLEPLVSVILSATTNSLDQHEKFKLHRPNHKMYAKEIGDEIRSFGGHSLRNLFRGEGPPYEEIVVDVCKRLNVPYQDGNTILNEERLLINNLEAHYGKVTKEQREKAFQEASAKAKSLLNNKINLAGYGAALVSTAPLGITVGLATAMGPAYRVTAPCVLHIAYLRRAILQKAGVDLAVA